jgi:hypothetical protein
VNATMKDRNTKQVMSKGGFERKGEVNTEGKRE